MKVKKRTRFLSLILSLVMIFSIIPMESLVFNASAATSITFSQISSKLEDLQTKKNFRPGDKSAQKNCWYFANAVSQKIFGVSMNSQKEVDGYWIALKTGSSCAYKAVSDTYKKPSTAQVMSLFKASKPGDIIQYRNSYTSSCHIAMIQSVTSSYAYIYHATTTNGVYYVSKSKIRLDSAKNFETDFGKFTTGGAGITFYRYKNVKDDTSAAAVSAPQIATTNVVGGVKITLSSATSGASVYYTTNGSAPSVSSTKYSAPFTISSTATIKALAEKSGMVGSSTASKTITVTKVATPSITCTTTADGFNTTIIAESGATVYYTTDGTNPSTSSTKYTGAFKIYKNATIKAIAVSSGKANSAVASSVLSAAVPSAPTAQLDSSSVSTCGISDKINVKWNKISNAYEYIVTVKNNGTVVSEESTQGCVFSYIPTAAGTYTVTVKAVNFIGESAASSPAVTVTVKPDVTVTFKDYDSKVISSKVIHWGGSISAPASPSRKGYTFKEWSGTYSGVKADSVVTAVYTPITYTVTFVNESGTTLKTTAADYDSAVTPPTAPAKTGYTFVGWSVKSGEGDSYTKVNGNVTFEPTYAWSSPDMPLAVSVEKALRSPDAKSYTVTVKVTNSKSQVINGKLITVIKTTNGKIVATEINAIVVPANASEKEYTVTVTSTNSAMSCEAYIVANDPENSDRTGGAYSAMASCKVTKETTSSYSYWSDWSDWSATAATASSTQEVETKTQYRYRDKQTTTSTSSTLSGWTPTGGSTVTYGAWGSWSSWSTTKQTASETKGVETRTVYYYFHYCDGNGNFAPSTSYSYGKYGPHEIYSTKKLTVDRHSPSVDKDIVDGETKCVKGLGSYYYGGTKTQYRYRTRTKTTIYSFWKWGDYSDWSDTVYTANDSREVETRTLYRYRTLQSGTQTGSSDYVVTENLSGKEYSISGNLSNITTNYSGKKATVLVYKDRNTDPTENQIEYIGQITLGTNNSYSFSFIPKEEISVATGNYVVSFGIATADGLINNVAYIEAPKVKYKVEFLDTSGNILSTQNADKGSDATAPALPVVEGCDVRWNRAYTNISSDTTVRAEATPRKYNVIFVDWANSSIVDIKEVSYGSKVTFPTDRTATGKRFIGWSVDEDSIITGTTVVEAVYEDIMYTVTFLNKDGSTFFTESVPYGGAASLPQRVSGDESVSDVEVIEPEAAGYKFIAWSTDSSWWNVKSNITVNPIFVYAETVEAPQFTAFDEENINYAIVDMETSTVGAEIHYTLDGSTPDENSAVYEDSIILETSSTVKAIAVSDGMNTSSVSEKYVEIIPETYEEYKEGDPALRVSSAVAASGKTVEVTVSIENNPGLIALGFSINYDMSVMQLVGVQDNGLFGEGTFTCGDDLSAAPYTVLWEDALSPKNYTDDGVVATFTFAVNSGVEIDEYPVLLEMSEGGTFDFNMKEYNLMVFDGHISISPRTPGDANDDGVVNTKDVVVIKRFLAGWSGVEINSANSDVNGDGLVNTKDVVVIKRYLAGWSGAELV